MRGLRFSTSYQFIQRVSKETRMKKIFGLMISSDASMEEAVTAEIQDEKFGRSWKKRKHPR
jgi:hypothetical protein